MLNMRKFISHSDFKKELLKDPEFKKAYDALGPQYELIALMIEKRLKEGLTQKEIARRMGTKQSAISRFESGNYNPSLNFMHELAEALGARIKISLEKHNANTTQP